MGVGDKNNGNGKHALTISERQRMRESLEWIHELREQDVDRIMRRHTNNGEDLSMKMVYEDCGLDTCILLWRRLARMTLHISERPLIEFKRLYARQNFNPDDPVRCAKALAALLGCSEQFVREALEEEPKEDPRQAKLELR